jgi:hypothetical protein
MFNKSGPTPFYSPETISQCINNYENLSLLENPLSLLDDPDERTWQLREFCTPMLIAVQHPSEHFQKLDTEFSRLLPNALERHPSQLEASSIQKNPQRTSISKTRQLITRLPRVPQRNFTLPLANGLLQRQKKTLWEGIKDGRWAAKYILPERQSQFQLPSTEDPGALLNLLSDMQDLAWDNLFVTTYMDTNSVVLAHLIATRSCDIDPHFARDFLHYVNLLSELLDTYRNLCDIAVFGLTEALADQSPSVQALKSALFPDKDDDHEQGRAVLKVFLWTAWQRAVMLYFYYIVGVQLSFGSSASWNVLFAIRGIQELSDVSADVYRGNRITYLCNWAFELLRISRPSLGLDFRRMLHRFNEHFAGRNGRCIKDSNETCCGDRPSSCQRFTGAETKAQSAHGFSFKHPCHKIQWSEMSYKKCLSPRAVMANAGLTHLTYCHIASHTLAISHVWSHGHGGRPETGINSCLHELYSSLARSLDCQAYWIDSACIPSDDPWRKNAIRDINKIFTNSRATVIIDQDLQSIDLSSPTIQNMETLLSVLLVCDWNVRAWTMLEAIRGSESIYLLCKDSKLVNLRETLVKVHREGSVDIAVLLGSAQHLIPQTDPTSSKTIEEAGYLLSQRHASRADDEVVIWNLLTDGPGHKDAVTLWKSQTHVRTGFLISSADRIQGSVGFSWAPRSPYVRPQRRSVALGGGREQIYTIRFPSYDGMGSFCARITEGGLRGKWQVMDIDSAVLESYFDLCCQRTFDLDHGLDASANIQETSTDMDHDMRIFAHPDEAFAYRVMEELLNNFVKVRLLRPLAEDGVTPYEGGTQRGESFGLLAVMCVSVDGGETWEWKNVHQWQESNNADAWRLEEMVLV